MTAWPLLPSQHKREADLDQARLALAHAASEARDAGDVVLALQRHAAAVQASRREGWDMFLHTATARFLAELGDRIVRAQAAQASAEERAGVARQACVACHQRLELVLAVRDAQAEATRLETSRRAAAAADDDWLLLHGGAGA